MSVRESTVVHPGPGRTCTAAHIHPELPPHSGVACPPSPEKEGAIPEPRALHLLHVKDTVPPSGPPPVPRDLTQRTNHPPWCLYRDCHTAPCPRKIGKILVLPQCPSRNPRNPKKRAKRDQLVPRGTDFWLPTLIGENPEGMIPTYPSGRSNTRTSHSVPCLSNN